MSMSFTAAQAAALWAAPLLVLMAILSWLTVRQRRAHKVSLGDGGIADLLRAQRAFGNAAEYIPAGLAALALMVLAGAAPIMVHIVGGLLVLGRLAHGISMSFTHKPTLFGRVGGMVLTYAAYVTAAGSLLWCALHGA